MSLPTKINLLIISYYQRDKQYLLKMIVNVKLKDDWHYFNIAQQWSFQENYRCILCTKDGKESSISSKIRKVAFEIHLCQNIYIENKHRKRVTHLEKINGLFKINKNLQDDKALA